MKSATRKLWGRDPSQGEGKETQVRATHSLDLLQEWEGCTGAHRPVGMQDGAATAGLIDDDRRGGDGALGLKDHVL